MNCREFALHIEKLNIGNGKLSELLWHNPSYLSSIISREQSDNYEIQSNLEFTIHLLMFLKINNYDIEKILDKFKEYKNKNNKMTRIELSFHIDKLGITNIFLGECLGHCNSYIASILSINNFDDEIQDNLEILIHLLFFLKIKGYNILKICSDIKNYKLSQKNKIIE